MSWQEVVHVPDKGSAHIRQSDSGYLPAGCQNEDALWNYWYDFIGRSLMRLPRTVISDSGSRLPWWL